VLVTTSVVMINIQIKVQNTDKVRIQCGNISLEKGLSVMGWYAVSVGKQLLIF